MTRENRMTRHTCPDCDNSPILMDDGDLFCDLCNNYFQQPAHLPKQ